MSTAISHFARSADNAGVVAVLPGKLSIGETTSFATCEETIRKGLKTFYEVGHALARIRDEQLYRAEFGTFREYCAQRWQMTDRHARHMIDSSEAVRSVVEQLGPGAPLPATESQARPLATLPPAKRGAAWEEAVKSALAGKVTAKHVQAAVDKRRPQLKQESQKATKEAKWPEPDKNGVYSEVGAETQRFINAHATAEITVLQITSIQWIWKTGYQFKIGNMYGSCGPLRAPKDWTTCATTRAEALRMAVGELKRQLLPIFSAAGQDSGGVNASIYEPWLEKAGQKGCRRMLEQLIKRPQITRQQLGTLAGISYKSSTFRGYMSWLRSNGLVETQGDAIKLLPV